MWTETIPAKFPCDSIAELTFFSLLPPVALVTSLFTHGFIYQVTRHYMVCHMKDYRTIGSLFGVEMHCFLISTKAGRLVT